MMEQQKAISQRRRDLIKLSIFAGIAGALPRKNAWSQEKAEPIPADRPMPTVDARFPAEMAPGVFIIPDKRIPLVPNIGIIIGTESALVVDCGLGIDSAENVLRLVRELAPGRRIILTVTHAHPEHGFGAQVFREDARIYYNAAQRDHFMRTGQALLRGFRENVPPRAHVHLLDGIQPVSPHETYDGAEAMIDLGGREVRFKTWGTAHSPGDQIVYLPGESILFAGDLLEERMFPIVPFFPPMIETDDINLSQWETVLNEIITLQPKMIVPGHGNLGSTEIPKEVQGYFQAIRELVDKSSDTVSELEAVVRDRYPTWENPQFILPALAYLSQQG